MQYNFSFLKKHKLYDSFSGACIEAEKGLVVSYASTAILTRRALELAVKWVFSYDEELNAPYQDNLATLIHDYTFRSIIDVNLLPMLKYIQQLGNKAVHTSAPITREEAILALRNLFEFISWIDYCYSDELNTIDFDESILQDNEKQKKTRKELQDLYERLGSKDRKLEEVIKENEELRKKITAKRIENGQHRDFKVDEISEFKTRKMYIDLELQLAGWNIGTDCREEIEVQGMPNSSGVGFVDYVLYGDDGKPLAVIEAKKTSVDSRIGKQQAKLYADCLEKEHNIRPVIFYTNGFEYYLWDDVSYPERQVSGIYTKSELEWLIYKRKNKKSLKTTYIKNEITNRPYQKMAIQAVCDILEKGHRKALLVMATGSGKTRTAISIVDVLINKGWIKNILFLADRTALVRQAKKNFKNLLPELSLCNLLDNKDNPESRMIFSTYPTMMNAIDETKSKDGSKLFSSGHFDLIIIDESHRSIYKKYQAIFDYFDGILLGLTATPKSDIDKNTYEIFDLENNVPTYAYELGEAIKDGYLVPYHTIETKMKFMEEGIHYDDLSEEEKEHFEETFDDGVTDISGEALNSFLFNNNTIDTVLHTLMEQGIKVEGGDKLGKTIIFAKNKKHADFIVKRFNILYPKYNSGFIKTIYTDIKYVDTLIDDFSTKDKLPQIAVSVDMLDTGIDIPEIVNLVFFKKVRSKAKFWQMIGRGTRLCENLFGVEMNKDGFRIFDYCSNFEYFRENKMGKEAKLNKSLTEKLFNIKTEIIKELQRIEYQNKEYMSYRESLVDELIKFILQIDENRFDSRMKIKYIHKYNKKDAWNNITDKDIRDLEENITPLIPSIEDDELAKRFDYLMLTIEYSDLKGIVASKPKMKVITTAEKLSTKGTIATVKRQEHLITKVQTDEFWQEADIFEYEIVRKAFRDLIKFLDANVGTIYYTNFTDEVMEVKENEGEFNVNDLQSYRKKVNQYLKEHEDDLVVYKLRNNKPISEDDIKHLEKILWKELGTRDDYINEYGDEPLLRLASRIVGLDPTTANEAFSEFLSDETLNSNQMEFVKLVVDFIIDNGIIDKSIFNDQPFNKFGNVVTLFGDKLETAKSIMKKIDELNARIDIG
ncbi:type I restriction enzyme EcoKI R protein [Gottschalkia purinilytica]|uniref:Type I restriction enzyme EcoKI R protein n=1 Tax=Gottschalkia purinilytica TaxID=1503 RepID=A0A0L0WEN3_GOTPU|nr:DEAD/DEAH box helicase family protein [Gottschalkia purinilytica]KNF09942.1 type I restriction enzyme EcoKI R protein [Gottschalkia purinilytica]